MQSARGVNGFFRYWGPENGGVNDQNKALYGALLKVFLAAKSLRWFCDTYLTPANIAVLLGSYSPELNNLKNEWYGIKLLGCNQGNSQFPLQLWLKKKAYWEDELLEDGMFKTMMDSMNKEPILVDDPQETLTGKRSSTRKATTIELRCSKTHGCKFVSKNRSALTSHERKCCPQAVAPPTNFICETKGCTYATKSKSALTKHTKTCSAVQVVVPPVPALPETQVFACPQARCRMTHTSRKDSLAHQRTHQPNSPAAENRNKRSESESSSQHLLGEMHTRTAEKKKKKAKASTTDTPVAAQSREPPFAPTKGFKCPYKGCDKSHATSELAQVHQQKHLQLTQKHQVAPSAKYLCPECDKSHATAERSHNHQRKHRTHQQSRTDGAEATCPQCNLYRGTAAQVLAHITTCRAALTHQPRQTDGADSTCPECNLYRGTAGQVLAHITACRAALTCPDCFFKSASQPQLFAHIVRCANGAAAAAAAAADTMNGRKRQRVDEDEENWKPNRIRNKKTNVKLHWMRSHVKDWLKLVELQEYESKFHDGQVDGRILLNLTEEDIKSEKYGMTDTHAGKFLELRAGFD
jgi:hypothetical protein